MAESNNYIIATYDSMVKATHQGTPFEIYRFDYSEEEFTLQSKPLKGVVLYLMEGLRDNGETVIFPGTIKNGKDLMSFVPDQTVDWRRFYFIVDASGEYLTINTVDYLHALFYLQANYGTSKYDPTMMTKCKSTMSDKAIRHADIMYRDVFVTLDILGLHLQDLIRIAKTKRKRRAASQQMPGTPSRSMPQTSSTPFYPSQMMPQEGMQGSWNPSVGLHQQAQQFNVQSDLNYQQQPGFATWLPRFMEQLNSEQAITDLYTHFPELTDSNSLLNHLVGSLYIPILQYDPSLCWTAMDQFILVKRDNDPNFLFSMNVVREPTYGLKITLWLPPTRVHDPHNICYTVANDIYQTYTTLTSASPESVAQVLDVIQQVL